MLGPLFGIFCAKFQSSPLDISGNVLQTVFTFCYIFVTTKKQLALLQIGLGISGGLSTTTWYALYERCKDKIHEA
jgi:hypothetical protein